MRRCHAEFASSPSVNCVKTVMTNLAWLAVAGATFAAHGGPAESPQAGNSPVQFVKQAHVTDSFWSPMLERNRTVTIPHNLRMCREVGIVANFERVAGLREGDYYGLPNWDEFLYKAIEAASYALRQRPDAALEKEMKSGDTIELDLPMPVRRVVAHAKVEDCAGKVALQRGPIVYCFEGADHGGNVLDLTMPAAAAFVPRRRDDLLGGTVVLEGQVHRRGEHIRATAIPYHLWSNRGPGEMAVWLEQK